MKKFRFYRQLEEADCGIACIRMVARHYGKDIPWSVLRSATDIGKLGVSVRDICLCCGGVGIDTVAALPSVGDLYRAPCDAILHWRQNHFVVLYRTDRKRRRFRIADPSEGPMWIDEDVLRKAWADESGRGIAIFTMPSGRWESMTFSPKKRLAPLLGSLFGNILTRRRTFMAVIALSIVCMCVDIAIPFMFKGSIDDGLQAGDLGLLWTFVLFQFAFILGGAVSSNISSILMTRLGIRVNMDMLWGYLSGLASRSQTFFDRRSSSTLIQKMEDQRRLKDFLISLPESTVSNTLTLVVFSSLLIYFSPPVFCIFLLLSIVETAWGLLFIRRRRALDYGFFNAMSENRNIVYELVNGMTEIRANNASDMHLGRWRASQEDIDRMSLRSACLGVWNSGGIQLIGSTKNILITGICASMVIGGTLTLGVMMTVGYLVGRLSQPFSYISNAAASWQQALLSHERLDEVMTDDAEPRGDRRSRGTDISLRDVWYRYPGSTSPYVLRNINLEIRPGTTVALVGESGCGKSTLVKLMLGFYTPQEGHLTLGGNDITDCDRDEWLTHCGVVMQDGYIFSDTILANVSMKEEDTDNGRAMEALHVAGLDEFVSSLPNGVHTRIGTTGLGLSGGQKQRLLIARAVYRKPDILFLDEATSSLDARNEKEIHNRLHEFCRGRTVVIAAHRLSTVRDADLILYIEGGEIKEAGTHGELLAGNGGYHRLVGNQLSLSV